MNSNSLAVYDYITCAGCRPGTKNASRMAALGHRRPFDDSPVFPHLPVVTEPGVSYKPRN